MQEKCWSGQPLYFAHALAAPLLVILVLGHCFAYLYLHKPPATTVRRNFHKYLTAGYQSNFKRWEIRVLLDKLAFAFMSLAYAKLECL